MPPRISSASPQTLRASRVARNFRVGVRMRSSAAASWLPASPRSSASAVRKLIDSACSVGEHDLHQLPPRQRQIDDAASEHHAILRHRHRVVMRAAHQRGGFDAVGEPRRIDHFGHLHEAAIEPTDRIRNRAFQLDLARGHRAGAELVLEPNDPVVVGRAVVEEARHQEQADAARAGTCAFRPRQQHHHLGVRIGAEPFLAVEPPVVAFLHRRRRQRADVGAALLLGHELAALRQPAHVGLRQAVEIFRLQRLAAEFRKQLGATVGDIDRAAQPELGLVEQEREGVLCHHGIGLRPAHDALAQRHRVNAEFAEGGALQFAIGRMILDPLRVAPETVALVQHRHVAVGEPRAFVEMTAGERPEPVEMRLDMAKQRVGQMDAQADPSAPDRRGRNSSPTYPARAIPADRPRSVTSSCLAGWCICNSCSFRQVL